MPNMIKIYKKFKGNKMLKHNKKGYDNITWLL